MPLLVLACYIFNVIGFCRKQYVMTVYISHVTATCIVAFHAFTPYSVVLDIGKVVTC
nr:MAG TPA: hypothetical protein [Caudoviricetes sp.]